MEARVQVPVVFVGPESVRIAHSKTNMEGLIARSAGYLCSVSV